MDEIRKETDNLINGVIEQMAINLNDVFKYTRKYNCKDETKIKFYFNSWLFDILTQKNHEFIDENIDKFNLYIFDYLKILFKFYNEEYDYNFCFFILKVSQDRNDFNTSLDKLKNMDIFINYNYIVTKNKIKFKNNNEIIEFFKLEKNITYKRKNNKIYLSPDAVLKICLLNEKFTKKIYLFMLGKCMYIDFNNSIIKTLESIMEENKKILNFTIDLNKKNNFLVKDENYGKIKENFNRMIIDTKNIKKIIESREKIFSFQ